MHSSKFWESVLAKAMNPVNVAFLVGATILTLVWLGSNWAHSQSAATKKLSDEQQRSQNRPAKSSRPRHTLKLHAFELQSMRIKCRCKDQCKTNTAINSRSDGERRPNTGVSSQFDDGRETAVDVDIITIHGLDTNSESTWVWDNPNLPQDPHNGTNWLAHKHMLPKLVGRARILTCDWPAELVTSTDYAEYRLEELARLLLDAIKNSRLECGDERPILFIASCLGGVIVMKALSMADKDYRSIRTATGGVIFLATPFRGTLFDDVSTWAEPGLALLASTQAYRVSSLLKFAKPSIDLAELVRDITDLHKNPDYNFEVFTFYETKMTSLYRKIPYYPRFLLSATKHLVDQGSATLDCVKHPLSLARPHSTMNKFKCPEDPNYKLVAGKTQEFLKRIRDGTPLAKADRHIYHKHYNESALRIDRLSGDPLPMDKCYINLAIVETLAKGLPLSHVLGGNAAQSSPFSFSNRLNIETPAKERQIKLSTLFEKRKSSDGQEIIPRRILIHGRAGVGKTTLCKKIVYDYIQNQMWKGLFARILWIPLRRLKQYDALEDLADIFSKVFLTNHTDRKILAQSLQAALTKPNDCLLILDGLDEVSDLLYLDNTIALLLRELLNSSNVIVLTRPHVELPRAIRPPDIKLEVIGFFPDQVQEYLKVDSINDALRAEQIGLFLREHPLVAGLARIPIQLDALCLIWDETLASKATSLNTMTAIYCAIEQCLWKKDAQRLGILTPEGADKAGPNEMERNMGSTMALLGCLAFNGMYNNIVEFQPAYKDLVLADASPPDGFTLDTLLEKVSFLRTSDTSIKSASRNYHFLHLTYQEFFAAKHFVQQWRSEHGRLTYYSDYGDEGSRTTIPPKDFLRKYKYVARYDIVWRFVAGLLGSKVSEFFEAIEEGPLDLIGPVHQRLISHCLSETSPSACLHIRPGLEKKLSQWVLFECDIMEQSLLASESEFPDKALNDALDKSSDRQKLLILSALSRPGRHLSNQTIAYLGNLLTGIDFGIESTAVYAPEIQPNLLDDVVIFLIFILGREDRNTKEIAAAVIGNRLNISNAAITRIVRITAQQAQIIATGKRLADAFWPMMANVLGTQTKLQENTIATLVGMIQNNATANPGAMSLENQMNLPEEILAIISALGEEDSEVDQGIQDFATEVLRNQSSLSKKTVTILTTLAEFADNKTSLCAVTVLADRPDPPEQVVAALVRLLQDGVVRRQHRFELEALINTPTLSLEIIEALVPLLEDEHFYIIRADTALALARRLDLHDNAKAALESLGRQGEIERALSKGPKAAPRRVVGEPSEFLHEHLELLTSPLRERNDVMGSGPDMPEYAIKTFVPLLADAHCHYGSLNAQILSWQSKLSEETVKSIVTLLGDERQNGRWNAAHAVGTNPALMDKILGELGILWRPAGGQLSLRTNGSNASRTEQPNMPQGSYETLRSLYGSFICRGFREQFWLQIDEKLNLSLHQPNGSRVVCNMNLRSPDEILEWRRFLNVREYRL
ncbi:armadillo-type protein [Nemania sp. FL0031]|nr:armadillo-type protein [Nemania sp. FL0031]